MARKVSAVRIASAEYQGCPPRVVRGSPAHASTASAVNQTVKLPRWRKLASYSRQFVILCRCRGICWRRSWFSLKGTAGIQGSGEEALSYATQLLRTNRPIHAPRCRTPQFWLLFLVYMFTSIGSFLVSLHQIAFAVDVGVDPLY